VLGVGPESCTLGTRGSRSSCLASLFTGYPVLAPMLNYLPLSTSATSEAAVMCNPPLLSSYVSLLVTIPVSLLVTIPVSLLVAIPLSLLVAIPGRGGLVALELVAAIDDSVADCGTSFCASGEAAVLLPALGAARDAAFPDYAAVVLRLLPSRFSLSCFRFPVAFAAAFPRASSCSRFFRKISSMSPNDPLATKARPIASSSSLVS